MRCALWLSAFLFGLGIALPAWAVTCPPLPYNLLNGTIVDAVQVMADLNALRNCINGGSGGAATLLNVGEGFTKTPGVDNDTPVNLPTDTLYGQAMPVEYSLAHNVVAQEMSHVLKAMGSALVPFTLPSAGTAGFEKGNLVCFNGIGSGGFTLQTVSGTLQGIGVNGSGIAGPFHQYSNACANSDPPNWVVSFSNPNNACGANPNANLGFFPVLIKTTDYTVQLADQCSVIVYHGAGPATFTLPAPTAGFVFWVQNLSIDMSDLTLSPPTGTVNYGATATVPYGSGGMLDSDGVSS